MRQSREVRLHTYTHIALRVTHLQQAEAFYRDLFLFDVAFREAELDDGWHTLPATANWADAESASIQIGLVMLYRDGLRLALERVDLVSSHGPLSHIGIHVDAEEIHRLREVVLSRGCPVVTDRERAFVFDDPYGIRWEIDTFPYDDPPSMSTGVRGGRWLDLRLRKHA